MRSWINEKGISHLVTTRNTPQNNGTAERMNRTLIEKARTLRIESDLPKHLWAELVSTAAFLYNRDPKTNPYEKMWGVEPNLKHIRPVGSDVFYSIHHFEKIGKLDPRCRQGTLVGFDKNMSSYRIWDKESRSIVRSRDVVFKKEEKEMGEMLTEESRLEEPLETPVGDEGESEEVNNQGEDQEKTLPIINEGGDMPQEELIDNQSDINNIRKSNREKKQVQKYGNWKTYMATQQAREEDEEGNEHEITALQTFVRENAIIPDSFKTAKMSKEWPAWRKAIFTELDSIIENGVFDIIKKEDRDREKTLINTRWVLNKKFDTDGTLKRYKARCVARGFKQKEGIDFEETFSPTGRLSTMRYILNYAAQKKIKPRQADFVTAYLNSILEEEEAVYISLPEGFVEWIRETKQETYNNKLARDLINNPEGYIIKLKKTLYGLKQAARGWYTTMTNWFIKNGY